MVTSNSSCLSSMCLALAELRREEGREVEERGWVELGEGGGLGEEGRKSWGRGLTCTWWRGQEKLARSLQGSSLFPDYSCTTDDWSWSQKQRKYKCRRRPIDQHMYWETKAPLILSTPHCEKEWGEVLKLSVENFRTMGSVIGHPWLRPDFRLVITYGVRIRKICNCAWSMRTHIGWTLQSWKFKIYF